MQHLRIDLNGEQNYRYVKDLEKGTYSIYAFKCPQHTQEDLKRAKEKWPTLSFDLVTI